MKRNFNCICFFLCCWTFTINCNEELIFHNSENKCNFMSNLKAQLGAFKNQILMRINYYVHFNFSCFNKINIYYIPKENMVNSFSFKSEKKISPGYQPWFTKNIGFVTFWIFVLISKILAVVLSEGLFIWVQIGFKFYSCWIFRPKVILSLQDEWKDLSSSINNSNLWKIAL